MMDFYITKLEFPSLGSILYLQNGTGLSLTLDLLQEVLQSETFIKYNPNLVRIFKQAEIMMKRCETGPVIVNY